jgi:cytochrome o ubiquinol oxidase operon protein cyoD
MSEFIPAQKAAEVAPGDLPEGDKESGVLGYIMGLILAGGLTAVSFYITRGSLFWAPSIPTALIVLAIAQMGVHLVFFLHVTSGPDSNNNVLALAFGILIVFLIIAGSLWIMGNLDHNMHPMDQIMKMQR